MCETGPSQFLTGLYRDREETGKRISEGKGRGPVGKNLYGRGEKLKAER